MSVIHRSKQSAAANAEASKRKYTQRQNDEKMIEKHRAYTNQLKAYNRVDKAHQIRYLKRIRRRLPCEILRIIYEYLTTTVVKYLADRTQYKRGVAYYNLIGEYIIFCRCVNADRIDCGYMSSDSHLSTLITQIPIRVLKLFTQSSIATNCYGLIMGEWDDTTDLHDRCVTYNSYKHNIYDKWIYDFRLGDIVLRLHAKIERGDLSLIPITRRFILAIQYLATNSVYTEL